MILDRFQVTGKAAVVTGAGRGIGAATAVALAEAGADVVISSRNTAELTGVAEQIEQAGRRARIVTADLSDLTELPRLAQAAQEDFGRLDIVVNNVGGTMPGLFLDTTPEQLIEAFQFNVATAHALNRAAVPLMLNNGGGSIVNISSAMGRLTGRGFIAYGTAKAALAHYTRLAATDLAPRVRVNAISVGSVATSALDIVLRNEELKSRMEQATPLKVIGEPADIAATIVYLTSTAGKFVTGKVFEVDGGSERPTLELGLEDL
ncbi:MAG: SDR family oxidoreductase [Kibdelosporangium sp.]